MPPTFADPSEDNPFSKNQLSRVARDILEREVRAIFSGWMERLSTFTKSEAPDFKEDPDDWMVRHTYRLVRWVLNRCDSTILDSVLEADRRRHRRLGNIEGQPFKQALVIIAGWNPHGGKELMTRQRRMELGDAMAYAYRHKVPVKYVNGFIKQAGLKRIQQKKAVGYVEPGFTIRSAE